MPTRKVSCRPSFFAERRDVALHGVDVFAAGLDDERDAGGPAILAVDVAQRGGPFAGGDAGFRGGERGGHDVLVGARVGFERGERGLRGGVRCAAARQALRRAICSASTARSTVWMFFSPASSGEGSASVKHVDADDLQLAALDRLGAAAVGLDQRAFMYSSVRRAAPPTRFDVRQFGARAVGELARPSLR